ncbi:hypothetical protein BGZ76_007673 [Entomortierella beljakovae]|nr:hypothetical protein BGZ76_007673 [Entomortierella beljakovae]
MLLDKIKGMIDLSVVKNIVLDDLCIDFTHTESWTTTISSDNMYAHLTRIPGFSWPIQKVQIRVVVQDNGEDLGKLESPYQPASVSKGVVNSSISRSTMAIFDNSKPAFSEFVASLATKDCHTFVVKGSADIIFSLGILGTHHINGVDFLSDLTIRGLNNLPEITCKDSIIASPNDGNDGSDGNELVLKTTLDILNPSQLSLTLGDFSLSIVPQSSGNETETDDKAVADQQHIGTITIENLTLMLGMNKDRVATIKLNTNLEETNVFLKRAEQEPQTVFLKGFHGTSKNEALTSGLTTMRTTFVIPKIITGKSSTASVYQLQ